MSKTDKIIAYIMQQLNLIGENFGWQIGKVGANYENGYMKCSQDSKAHFRKEKIRQDIEAIINDHSGEVTEKVVTNADRIRAYNDEDLREFLSRVLATNGNCMWDCKDYDNKGLCKCCEDCWDGWLKEKVE